MKFSKRFLSMLLIASLALVGVIGVASADETTDEEELVPFATDGRINSFDSAAPVVVYSDATDEGVGLEIWRVTSDNTYMELVVTPAELEAAIAGEEAVLIAQEGGTAVYRLTTGEIQVIAASNNPGETYYLTFAEPYANVGYSSAYVK